MEPVEFGVELHNLLVGLEIHLIVEVGADAVALALLALTDQDEQGDEQGFDGDHEAERAEGRGVVPRGFAFDFEGDVDDDPGDEEREVEDHEPLAGTDVSDFLGDQVPAALALGDDLVGVFNAADFLVGFALAFAQDAEHVDGGIGVATEEVQEVLAGEDQELGVFGGADVCGSGAAVEEGDFAEEVAGPEGGELHFLAGFIGAGDEAFAVFDDVEVVALVAEPDNRTICREGLGGEHGLELGPLFSGERGEQGDRGDDVVGHRFLGC